MNQSIISTAVFLAAGCAAWGSPLTSIWTEPGDAGTLPASAQITYGGPVLTDIEGKLTDGTTGADMYQIKVTSNAAFSALVNIVDKTYLQDPSLYLFDSAGNALWGVETDATGQGLTGLSLTPGLYYIMIAPTGNDPENKTPAVLFNNTSPNVQVGPNSLTDLAIKKYTGGGNEDTGKYDIQFSNSVVDFAQTPEPANAFLMGGGLLLLGMWKRSRLRASRRFR